MLEAVLSFNKRSARNNEEGHLLNVRILLLKKVYILNEGDCIETKKALNHNNRQAPVYKRKDLIELMPAF